MHVNVNVKSTVPPQTACPEICSHCMSLPMVSFQKLTRFFPSASRMHKIILFPYMNNWSHRNSTCFWCNFFFFVGCIRLFPIRKRKNSISKNKKMKFDILQPLMSSKNDDWWRSDGCSNKLGWHYWISLFRS